MSIKNHLRCTSQDISAQVLLPGDPGRAKYIALGFLKNGKKIAENREFVTYGGTYKGHPVTVVSTGIGCPSTAIAVEELIDLGARRLIRVGTCGGALRKEIQPGALVVPTACIREEGTTREYVPEMFPAVADFALTAALVEAAQKKNFSVYTGINRTHDAFYGSPENIKRWGELLDRSRYVQPILSSEMEAAALFVIALLRGVQAGAVLAVNDFPEDVIAIARGTQVFDSPQIKSELLEAQKSVDRSIETALEGLIA